MNTFTTMNTQFLLDGLSEADCSTIKKLMFHAEATFSRFREDSEVSLINRNKGQWVKVSPLTFRLLEDAYLAFQGTEGIFNPFLGTHIQRIGYKCAFDLLPQEPSSHIGSRADVMQIPDVSAFLLSDCGSYLQFDQVELKVCLSPFADLDLGGIAKGWIAQYAAEQFIIRGVPCGLIDAGGDVILWGKEPRQQLWGVEVAHPFYQDQCIADLWLEGMTAMATSNIIKRSWLSPSGEKVHHILDPRTGMPANSDLIQVTVLTRDLTTSEQYAKCLLILVSEVGFSWLSKHAPAAAYIAVRNDGKILYSANLDWYCTEWEVNHHGTK